jgi:hypothetical protein
MKRAWLLASGAVLSLLVLERAPAFGGHGHGGGKAHASKPAHEAPKHSGGKPAPHPAPKPQAKPHANPPHKPAPRPHGESNNTAQSSHAPDHKAPSQHGSNPAKPNAVGSNTSPKTKDEKTHNEHHDEHHWHHERWWHGHHQYWSEDGFWVDGVTGQPVAAADLAVPVAGAEGPLAGATPTSIATRPQIQFSVDPSERDSYDAAAQAAGTSRAEWIRSRLNDAARKELK